MVQFDLYYKGYVVLMSFEINLSFNLFIKNLKNYFGFPRMIIYWNRCQLSYLLQERCISITMDFLFLLKIGHTTTLKNKIVSKNEKI